MCALDTLVEIYSGGCPSAGLSCSPSQRPPRSSGRAPPSRHRPATPASPPNGNAITCENALPGTPQADWDVAGAGDLSIQGFATDISVNRGQTVQFKIDTDAAAYRLDIYRMGYYGGDGARLVATVTPSATLPQNQPDCLDDPATGLVDCGNWAVSASWAGARDRHIGHLFRARRASRHRRREPHRVHRSPRRRHLRSAVPDLRHHLAGLQPVRRQQPVCRQPGRPRLQGQLQPAVHDRGSHARRLGVQRRVPDGALAREQRLQRQLHDRRRLGSPGHGAPRAIARSCRSATTNTGRAASAANVEAARAAGVHLAFFSGNEVFWKTRWESSIAPGGATYRTLVCYKETHANAKIDPLANTGPAPGVIRASARRPMAAGPRTR